MIGTMAGNIMATIPTNQITRKEATMLMSRALNMLAIVAIGTAGAMELMPMGEEAWYRMAERYHAPMATTRRGTPIESLKPELEVAAFDTETPP